LRFTSVSLQPDLLETFLHAAISHVEGGFDEELAATLTNVEEELAEEGIERPW